MEQTDAMIAKQVTHTAIIIMKQCRQRNCNSLEQEWNLKRFEQTAAKHTHKARWKMEQDELHSLRPDMHCSCLSINAAAEDAPMLIFEKIQKHFGIWNKPVRRSEPVIESPHMMSTLFNYLVKMFNCSWKSSALSFTTQCAIWITNRWLNKGI